MLSTVQDIPSSIGYSDRILKDAANTTPDAIDKEREKGMVNSFDQEETSYQTNDHLHSKTFRVQITTWA